MKKISALIILFLFIFGVMTSNVALAKGGHHCSFWKKVKCHTKKIGASVNNKVKDSYISTKKCVTGKKNKTWVKGHCTVRNGKKFYTKGHWRKVKNTPSQPSQGNNQCNAQGPVQGPTQGPSQK